MAKLSRRPGAAGGGRPARGRFLTNAGLLATGASTLAVARTAHAAGSDVLRIGLVGCGGRGSGAAADALGADPNTRLVAMGDAFADVVHSSREQLRKLHSERIAVDDDHCFAGFDAYRKVIESDVDVVLLATAPHFYPIHLRACIDAGKHVFCEKPHAVDAPGVRTIQAACEEALQKNLAVVSGLCWRYHHALRETIERIHDGQIGRVLAVQSTYNSGGRWHRGRQPDWSEMTFQMRNWYYFNWLSGDIPGLNLVHNLDKIAWVLGEKPPERAWGTGGRQVRTEPKYGDIYDHTAVVFEYDDGLRLHGYCRQQNGVHNEVSDVIFGTEGRAEMLKFRIDGKRPWRYRGPKCNMYDVEHQELFASIRAGRPINNGLYMTRSTMLALMARMANYTGQVIKWQEAWDSPQRLAPAKYRFDADPPTMPQADGRYPVPMPGIGA